jgi:DNA-binding MarR family transcriptional regulator
MMETPIRAPKIMEPGTDGGVTSDQHWRETRLQDRPGFVIRRLHQIHMALFVKECAEDGLTPVQYSVLTALNQLGPCEQVVVSRSVGLDRTSTADVVQRLERRKLVRRRVSPTDRRMKITSLTEVGVALLKRIDGAAAHAHSRTLEPLTSHEANDLMALMAKIVTAHDHDPKD